MEKPHKYSGLVPYKPGQSGNPAGSSRRQREASAARRVTQESLNRIAETLFLGDTEMLRKLASDPSITPVEKLVIAVILKAVEKGDHQAMNTILDRFIGKVKERVEVTPGRGGAIDVSELSDEELDKRREVLRKAMEDDQ